VEFRCRDGSYFNFVAAVFYDGEHRGSGSYVNLVRSGGISADRRIMRFVGIGLVGT